MNDVFSIYSNRLVFCNLCDDGHLQAYSQFITHLAKRHQVNTSVIAKINKELTDKVKERFMQK